MTKTISCVYQDRLVSSFLIKDESGETGYSNETVGCLFTDCSPLIAECAESPNARHPGHWPNTYAVLVPVNPDDLDAYPFILLDRRFD